MCSSNPPDDAPSPPAGDSRREFLRRTAAAAVALSLPASRRVLAQGLMAGANTYPRQGPIDPASVVRVSSKRLVTSRSVNRTILRESLAKGLCALARRKSPAEAWQQWLRPDDVVLLKFNQSGADRIGTTPPMAQELILSLQAAGWGPDRIMVMEATGDDMRLVRQTKSPDLRWQEAVVDFGKSGRDSFVAALDQATAIINVPFLKTHHLATMTSCMKNLSHGLIRHPSRFHANGCDPAIAEIVASKPIQGRLRLNIVNALQVVYEGGPEARASDLHAAGDLLISTDPVACDATGYGIINEIRALHELNPLLPGAATPRFVGSAARLGIGQSDVERIKITTLTV